MLRRLPSGPEELSTYRQRLGWAAYRACYRIGVGASFAKAFTDIHRIVFEKSKGRVWANMFGMPVVRLEVVGRKSGNRYVKLLPTPISDGEKIVVVASYGGSDRHPAWYLNICQQPKVSVTIRDADQTMVARTASQDEKREMWPAIVDAYRGYELYQRSTDRDIPVVILEHDR